MGYWSLMLLIIRINTFVVGDAASVYFTNVITNVININNDSFQPEKICFRAKNME